MRSIRVRAVLILLGAAVWLGAGAATLAAQTTGTVRGRVTAANTMRPLVGAQVVVEGTGRGSLTNSAGEFLIVGVPAGSHTVRAQMLGYTGGEQSVSVTAGQAATVEFQLDQSAIALDELIVTGTPGATQKRAIGNAVTSIKAEEVIAAAPIADVQELLTARTPGLSLMASSGQAGASSKIRIRGAGSLSGRLEPVIFVDGVRMYSGTAGGYSVSNGVVQGTNPLDAINPNDIESIEVIKGPAASTLYGADAAAGVIQIITKKGRGASGVQWTAELEAGQTDWHLDTPVNYWLCTPAQIGNAKSYPGCAGLEPNAPAEQRLLKDNPLRNTYECELTPNCQPNPIRTGDNLGMNLSVRGGGEGYNFFLSGERSTEDGVFYNNFANRTAGRANFGFTPSEKLNFNVNMSYARNHVQMPLNNNSSNSVLRNAFRGNPGTRAPWRVGFKGFTPELSNEYDNQTWTERTILGLTANYNPFSWFSNRVTFGMDNQDRANQVFFRIDETGRAPWGSTAATGEVNRLLPEVHVWTVDYAGTVNNNFNPSLSSAFSFGTQLNAYRYESHEAIGEGLVANNLNLVGSAAVTRGDQDVEQQNSVGFFVQEQLGWKDRLFLTGAVRVDDNSAFGEEFSVVVYPKASVSWVVSEEPFFGFPLVDQLKLRAAWGQAGNAPEPFSADRTLGPAKTTLSDNPVNQLTFAEYGNPNLKAETGSEVEVGFDASVLEGRLGVEFTYYNQRTKDALLAIPNPPSTGFSTGSNQSHLMNIGEIANSGAELLLSGSPIVSPTVTWDANLSLSTNRNELISFGGARDEIAFGAFATVQKHREGYPLGGFWATDVVRDEAGNPVLDSRGRVILEDSMEFVGPMMPTREVALTNTVTLFNTLRMFANVDYKGGNYQWCAICSIRNRFDRNTLQVNDPNAPPEQIALYTSNQTRTYIKPADFIKLRELSATFMVPSAWSRRFGSDQASITLAGRNLWMWSPYSEETDMVDPEVSFYSQSDFTQLDYGSAPMFRRLVLSARVAF
jgi:TonB-linked SusC/RagA family outer membrane protein